LFFCAQTLASKTINGVYEENILDSWPDLYGGAFNDDVDISAPDYFEHPSKD